MKNNFSAYNNILKDFVLRLGKRPIKTILTHENTIILYVMAIFVGGMGGVGAVLFRSLILLSSHIFRGSLANYITGYLGPYGIALIPAIGGLLVGIIIFYLAKETGGHGIPEVIESLHVHQGKMRARVPILKALVSSITLGSGGSAGREGPIGQIGAGIGSFASQRLKLNREQTKTLVNCGLAAGIAGSFNAPIGGALFAMEIIYRRPKTEALMPILVSSVMGAAVARSFLGDFPTFQMPAFKFAGLGTLPFFLLLGLGCGVGAYLWVKSYNLIETGFDKSKLTPPVKAAIGGLLVGLIGLLVPRALGVGYGTIELILVGGIAFIPLILLVFAKAIATSCTLGSGGSGGIFSPTLYLGAAVGGGIGLVFSFLYPSIVTEPHVFALVGMGAFLTATLKAPLTGIIMISELAHDYDLLIPLMLACALSYVISSILIPEDNMYTLALKKKGVKIKEEPFDILRTIKIRDVMNTKFSWISLTNSRKGLRKKIAEGHDIYPVLDKKLLVGYLTLNDLKKMLRKKDLPIENFLKTEYIKIYPDRTVRLAMDKLAKKKTGTLLVIERLDEKNILGVFTKVEIVEAYKKAIPGE